MEPARCCPWWMAYFFDNPLRKIFHKPETMLAPYLKPGMIALDLGCGMGFFSIAMAKMVGDKGKVISVDIQPEMLAIMQKRAEKAGVKGRITPVLSNGAELGVKDKIDFALAMWMLHEVRDLENFLRQVRECVNPGGKFLVVEPGRHVSREQFQQEIPEIERAGFKKVEDTKVSLSRAAIFEIK